MKKVFSKVLSVFLCAVLMLTVFSIGAFAVEEQSGTCGADLTWTLDASGELTISGTGNMSTYILTDAPWASYAEQIKSVTIEEGVTSIGNFAFENCVNLTKIDIADGLELVSGSAFAGCVKLTKVKLPDTVTLIGNNAFKGCTALEYVHIPSSVTKIGTAILADTNAYICSESIECYAKTYAEENGYVFETCKVTVTTVVEFLVFVLKEYLDFIFSILAEIFL